MTRVFYCSTLAGALTIAAGIDDGHFGAHDERRLLLVSSNVLTPEAYPNAVEQAGFATIRDRFDDIVSYNELIAPLHPSDWTPRNTEIPTFSRLLAHRLELEEQPAELVLESIPVAPARSIASLIRDCPITIYSDGLMSYGPTRTPLPPETAGRIQRLLHLDLVPDVTPLLLSEYGVRPQALPDDAFRNVVAGLPIGTPQREKSGLRGLILGQYMSALGLVTRQEELGLHTEMLDGLLAGGYTEIIFKPHPSAGRTHGRELTQVARDRGIELVIADEADAAEVLFRDLAPDLVVGCFSTALLTARMYGVPVATVGTELLLERVTPYQNSNRIPTTIADAALPRLQADGSTVDPPAVDLQQLVEAVGYCMQALAYPHLRRSAIDFLEANGRARYFKKRRLDSLQLLNSPSLDYRPPPKRAAPDPNATSAAAAVTAMSRRAEALRSAALERIRRRTNR